MKARIVFKGGSGSGHHGHAGVPGQRGGSAPGGGSGSKISQVAAQTRAKYGMPKHRAERAADTIAEDIGEMLNDNVRAKLTNVGGKGVATLQGYAGNADVYRTRIIGYLSQNKQRFGFESSEVYETKPGWLQVTLQFGNVDFRADD